MKRYLIIGGGVAAVGCVEGIRSRDTEGEIVLVCGEGRPAYCRPLISYYLQGKTDFERMKYRPDSFYAANGCELLSGRAAGVDAAGKTVTLEDGTALEYDRLCAATGSSAFVPPIPGLDSVKNKFEFMTQDDALALSRAAAPDSRVLIVGAGLIGLKCAEGLCGRVGSITVCDLAPRVLSSILDGACAALMQEKLEEHGVRFLLEDSVERLSGDTAHMKSGREARFDLLVLAVGVRPNTQPVQAAGAACGRGILVDTGMGTSLPGVYAAGDCAQGYDASTGRQEMLAILPNAYLQGRCAGRNMAGDVQVFDKAIPMNAIGFFGLHALTAGRYEGELYEKKIPGGVKRLFVKDGLLAGFILIGEADGAGVYTAMIREKIPVASVDFEGLAQAPSLAAFPKKYRAGVLERVV